MSLIRRVLIALSVLLALAGCGVDFHVHRDSEEPRGLASVPPATDEAIAAANSPEKWLNPFLVVHPNGIELTRRGDVQNFDRLTIERTEQILLTLPAEAWPMGRVVGVTELSILSGNDEERIAEHTRALRRMLASHHIRIEWWPSA